MFATESQACPCDGAFKRIRLALQHQHVVGLDHGIRERTGTARLVADDGRDLHLAIGEPVQIRHRLADYIGLGCDARLGDVILDVERRIEGCGSLAPLRQQAVAESEEEDAR